MAPETPGPLPLQPLDDPLISIIMPIYNERELIREVVGRVRALDFRKQLILVDDHSTDGTWDFLEAEQQDRPETVLLRHDRNQGKGAAIRTGLTRAQGDVVLIQDADLEYRPEDLPRLLEPIIQGRANVVYGSRFLGSIKDMKPANRVANHLLAWMVSVLYGQRVTDEATAYKIFRREVIEAIALTCHRFEFCPEVTAKVLRRGERILELPVHFEARTWEQGKKIGLPDFFQAVWVLLKCRF